MHGLYNFVCLRQSEAWIKTRITIFTKLVYLALELTIAKAFFNFVKLPWARSIFFKNITTMEIQLDSKTCQPCTMQTSIKETKRDQRDQK